MTEGHTHVSSHSLLIESSIRVFEDFQALEQIASSSRINPAAIISLLLELLQWDAFIPSINETIDSLYYDIEACDIDLRLGRLGDIEALRKVILVLTEFKTENKILSQKISRILEILNNINVRFDF